jgi:Helitron helicase-like domain at N-terminus
VDAWSAVEEACLKYIRDNQHTEVDKDEYEGDGDKEPSDNVRLPSTFVHSPAWSAANVSDCPALQKAIGSITLFITYTTNPTWTAISSELLHGQNASDHLDVVICVFQPNLSLFMKDLSKFMGPILYHIRITEFQKRGLPHAHIALALKNVPQTAAQISSFLTAEVPHQPGPLRDAVLKHMIHNHNPANSYH